MVIRNLRFNLDLDANTDGLQQGFNGAKFAVNALTAALAAVGVGLGIRELAEAADSYSNLSTRVQIATREHGNFNEAIAGVHQIAISTNSTLDATATLFTRLNTVGKDMGMSQQQALDLTKTITQAIQISGGSAQASEAAITQFIQAMQGGVLRGEEFNSIMENGFGLAEALAKGLGVTTGELRGMAEAGELSAERVVKAIGNQSVEIEKLYNQFPTTIGNALQRISTSWEILIGKMDQANGASATVAQWLVMLADNIGIVETLINDVGEGFVWFGDQLKKIDSQTIETVKQVLIETYGAVKELASTVGSAFVITLDVLNSALNSILFFGNGVDEATSKTNGFTKILQMLNVAVGIASDGFAGINIGLNLLVGALYSASSAFVNLLSTFTWGSVKEAALQNMAEMQAKAEEYYERASQAALNFESKSIAAYTEISKTAEQKNAESITNNQQKLDELKTQEQKHVEDYKAISDERIRLEQQLYDARKTGNQASIDLAIKALADLDAKEKAYQAESQKITLAKIEAAQAVADAMIKSADAAGLAQLKVLNVQLAAQGLQAEFDSTGKVIVKAMDDGTQAVENHVDSVTQARKAAKELELDLYELKNGYTEAFGKGRDLVNQFAKEVENLGFKGKNSGEVVYEAWLKWLNTAKSQGEIDFAKSKLIEFEEQGVFSAKQVENGMQAVRLVTQKLPADIDPVTAAFERLGIKTKEQLSLAAQSALVDFNTIQASGQATAESLKQAYERTMQAAAASGDQAVIAATQAKAASLGLQVQIDSTGKASVKSMDELTESNHRVRESAHRIGEGYRHAGQIARDEAKSVKSEWEKTVDAATEAFNLSMKQQAKALGSLDDYDSYSKADVINQLKSMGYSDADAKKRANSIWSEAMAADRDARLDGLGKSGFGGLNKLTDAEFDRAAAAGVTTQHGTNRINDMLNNLSTVSTGSTPYTPVSTPSKAAKDVNYNFAFNGQTMSLTGTPEQEPLMNQLVKQLQNQARTT